MAPLNKAHRQHSEEKTTRKKKRTVKNVRCTAYQLYFFFWKNVGKSLFDVTPILSSHLWHKKRETGYGLWFFALLFLTLVSYRTTPSTPLSDSIASMGEKKENTAKILRKRETAAFIFFIFFFFLRPSSLYEISILFYGSSFSIYTSLVVNGEKEKRRHCCLPLLYQNTTPRKCAARHRLRR